jgi:hypothetical protein
MYTDAQQHGSHWHTTPYKKSPPLFIFNLLFVQFQTAYTAVREQLNNESHHPKSMIDRGSS